MVTQQISSERNRHGFDWPEPLIIDLVSEVYGGLPPRERRDVARLHARALRQQVEGDRRDAALCRLDLLAACAARGVSVSSIEEADRLVFAELLAIARCRYRLSPQRCEATVDRLAGAMKGQDQPTARPVPSFGAPRPGATRARQALGLATV
jgi:hypothetical protein